ncbi:MAG: response regulator transcription factor [Anaerolineales bacterium]|nr:response regulator transcription factor [Anaerolineales bacterium]
MKPRILFADDDPEIHKLIALVLQDEAYEIITADNGLQATEIWRSYPIHLVILDINMPVMDGLEACRWIRKRSDVPIMMLTALDNEQDIVNGLEAGADDYIVKPFRHSEFIARIEAIMRRSYRQDKSDNGRLFYDKLFLDMDARLLQLKGKTIQISPLEFRLLRYLMGNIGVVVSKEELLQNVWGYEVIANDLNLVEATIRRLRKKLEMDPSRPHYIKTVWGAGYRFGG